MRLSNLKSLSSLTDKNKLTFILFAALVSGCASQQADFRWVNPTVVDNYSGEGRSVRDDWAKKIGSLPIELHGGLFNRQDSNAAEIIQNVIPEGAAAFSGGRQATFAKEQRIVLYADGVDIPEADSFCALEKRMRTVPEQSDSATLRGAVCDGPELIAYAKETKCSAEKPSCDISARVAHLKQSLVAALYPAPTLKQMRDIGMQAGW
jgi:hypothetical protein